MIFKTVDFNIFRENLQEIVYGEKRASQAENRNPSPQQQREKTTQKLTEIIIIQPITETRAEREKR